jgi:hypothetical protein
MFEMLGYITQAKCYKVTYASMPSPALLDLTGKIRKTQAFCFAIGVLADIWMGELSRGTVKQIVH